MTTRRISTEIEAVTTEEVKMLIPLSGTDHDSRIDMMIPALRMEAENMVNRSLADGFWQLKLDEFPNNEIRLLWPPIHSISSITYVDVDGVTQTLDPSLYYVDLHSEPGWILPAANTEWPDTYDTANAVTVNYGAGYSGDVPAAVKLWIAARIRADIDGCTDADAIARLNGLLDHLRIY